MTEQTIAIVSFMGALKREITKIQKRVSKVESISFLNLQIEAKGRMDGDIKILFRISDNEYDISSGPKGNDLDALTEEFMRRHGWEKRNAPLMLTSNERQRADADRITTNDPEPAPDAPFDGEIPW